jgi:hypothetical protein
MPLGFGNKEKETGKKKKKELDQLPTFAWLNQHPHWWVGWLPWGTKLETLILVQLNILGLNEACRLRRLKGENPYQCKLLVHLDLTKQALM